MSMELNDRDKVWNRAALEAGGANPLEGDEALAALLTVHGLVMNGGVDHAIEVLAPSEVASGIAGFRYFGLVEVAAVLEIASASNLGWERFNSRYAALIPADDIIVEAFHRSIVRRRKHLGLWGQPMPDNAINTAGYGGR